MKTKQLIEAVKAFFDPDIQDRQRQRGALKQVLDKLKQREKALKKELEHERKADRREALEKKIRLIHRQRKKGLKLLKSED